MQVIYKNALIPLTVALQDKNLTSNGATSVFWMTEKQKLLRCFHFRKTKFLKISLCFVKKAVKAHV
jgi:hypothetical protein